MQIKIKVKQPGRKQALIDVTSIDIENIGDHPPAEKLITAIVLQQVQAFNSRQPEKNLLQFLSKPETEQQAVTGKIGFGSIYNPAKADTVKAQQTAIQAFNDGMYALFADEEEITRTDQLVTLTPDTVLTFIRLSFLAGSYW